MLDRALPSSYQVRMDTFDAIRERRAIKHFDAEHRMSEAELSELIQLAVLSPTSFNMQNWRFVVLWW